MDERESAAVVRTHQQLCEEANRRRRRSIRNAALAILLIAVTVALSGCSVFLFGNDRAAYNLLVKGREEFKVPSSVRIESGMMIGDSLSCRISGLNSYGNRVTSGYWIDSDGSVYTDDSSTTGVRGELNYDAINVALGSTITGFGNGFTGFGNGGNGNMLIMIIILIVFLVCNGILASTASDVAAEKGYDKRTWFHMCFWLGGIAAIPYIIVAAMPDKQLRTYMGEVVRLQKETLERMSAGTKDAPAQATYFDDLPTL